MRSWKIVKGGTGVLFFLIVLVTFIAASPSAYAQPASMPPLMEQINHGNWLPQQDAEQLRDDLYYHNAIQAYITMLPALNTIGMRDGSEANFGKGYNVLPIWKDRMD